jgi:hypothetical protein
MTACVWYLGTIISEKSTADITIYQATERHIPPAVAVIMKVTAARTWNLTKYLNYFPQQRSLESIAADLNLIT